MIDQQTITRITDAAQIVDVVSDFVTLRRRGVNHIGLCPFHDEKTGSFTVSQAKGIYKCFGCGKAGGPINFVMEHEQLDYPGALRYLAKKYNIEITEQELSPEALQNRSNRESMFALNVWASRYFTDQMNNSEIGRAVGLGYFRDRGFMGDTIVKFGLGYCSKDYNAMSKKAIADGYQPDFIEKCGLGMKRDDGSWYDRFRGRVIFPIHSLSGKIVGFGGRILEKNDKAAKYVNSPESEIYHKSNELYGIYFAKQSIVKYDRCFLVEGYTDVISMHQSGVTNTVSSSGTALTHGQIRLIHRFTQNITVIYDGDSAGIRASIRGIDLLLEEGMNVKVVSLPEGEDPDSYAQSHNADQFVDFINSNQIDFIQFKIKLLLKDVGNDPIKRAELISDVVRSISLIPNQITRSVYIKECSKLLDVPENTVVSEIQKNLQAKRREELNARSGARGTTPQYRREGTQPPYQTTGEMVSNQLDNQAIRLETNKFAKFELEILRYAIRNGNDVIFADEDDNQNITYITVNQFILESLTEYEQDGKIFNSLPHQKMLDLMKNDSSGSTSSSRFFANHPDPEISLLAADLLSDKYEVSKIFTKQDEYSGDINDEKAIHAHNLKIEQQRINNLARDVDRVINEYKAALIKDKELNIDQRIREAQITKNDSLMMQLLREKQSIITQKREINFRLGNRVLV